MQGSPSKSPKATFGIHENGEPLTLDESLMMQALDIVRLTKTLVLREQLLTPEATLETRRDLEKLLRKVCVTTDGDPSEEWQAFCERREEQYQIMREIHANPEGYAAHCVFVDHMAPMFGHATKGVQMPIEEFDRNLEHYVEAFSKVSDDIAAKNRLQLREVLTALVTEEHLEYEKKGDKSRYLVGQVLMPAKEPLIDIEVHKQEFDFSLRNQLAK